MAEIAEAPPTDRTGALVERPFAATIDTLEVAHEHDFWRFYRLIP